MDSSAASTSETTQKIYTPREPEWLDNEGLVRMPYVPTPDQLEGLYQTKQDAIKEAWVNIQTCTHINKVMNDCVMKEGVNAEQTCGELKRRYMECIRTYKLNDWRAIQQDKIKQMWRDQSAKPDSI